jgi:hypothetical protein
LRRAIQSQLEDALAEHVLAGTFKEGDTIETVVEDEKITFKKTGKVAPKKVEAKDKSPSPAKAAKPALKTKKSAKADDTDEAGSDDGEKAEESEEALVGEESEEQE